MDDLKDLENGKADFKKMVLAVNASRMRVISAI